MAHRSVRYRAHALGDVPAASRACRALLITLEASVSRSKLSKANPKAKGPARFSHLDTPRLAAHATKTRLFAVQSGPRLLVGEVTVHG